MTVAESAIQKILVLPLEKQAEVLRFVEKVSHDPPPDACRKTPRGSLAHVPIDLTFEDFKQLRKEIWGTSTDRELDREAS